MKPFDLNLALLGHPVVTRDGKKVENLSFSKNERTYPLSGTVCGNLFTWKRNGSHQFSEKSTYDLFLADCELHPEPKYGDLVEVTDDSDSTWVKRIFICKTPGNNTLAVLVDSESNFARSRIFEVKLWDHMRPIQKDPNIKITVSINDKPARLSDISDETLRKIKEAEKHWSFWK
jgi:hypothetical protein